MYCMTHFVKHPLQITAVLFFAFGAISSAAPQSMTTDSDEKEVTAFRLTMSNVEKFANAGTAIMKLSHDNPALKKQMDEDSKDKTIRQSVATLDSKFPAVGAAIHGAGLSTHDFVVMTATIMSTTMAVGMKKQGYLKQLPPSVSAENAAFVEQNFDKLNDLLKKLMAENH
jgi:hypothetical protein